ncbi:MAG: M28 family peptidase, partial [Flavobacteriales bacterium]
MKIFCIPLVVLLMHAASAQTTPADSAMLTNIYNEVLANGQCYDDLHHLCKEIGHRLAGSEGAAKAIEWGELRLWECEPDSVFLMPVEVPHWTRGTNEYAHYVANDYVDNGMMEPMKFSVAMTALGGSVGTGGEITAQVVEVKSFDELKALGEEKVKGKIVFFNKAMDPMLINTGAAYGGAYPIRGKGPSEAARYGAVACIIRSLTLADDNYPHTGGTIYNDSLPKIPAVALSAVASRQLSQHLEQDPELLFTLHLSATAYPRTVQANVIAELRGTDFPDEYITIGGHLDSWDIGEGAHDDGAGIVQSIEVMRTLVVLGYKPRHTIRVVLFINEEFGNDGGQTYADSCAAQNLIHVAALESDAGGFTPMGFHCQCNDVQLKRFQSWKPLLEKFSLYDIKRGGSGVDIGPLRKEDTDRVALFGMRVDGQKYFNYHHSGNDIFENVDK